MKTDVSFFIFFLQWTSIRVAKPLNIIIITNTCIIGRFQERVS